MILYQIINKINSKKYIGQKMRLKWSQNDKEN